MPAYAARGLVLKRTRLGEADTIVTVLAEDGRQIRAVAKGARKTMSKCGARLQPFAVVRLLLHTGRTLDIVSEVETEVSHDGLRSDFDRTAHASVVVDLLDKTTAEDAGEPRLLALALATLVAEEDVPVEALPALTVAFLVKAMAMLGYRPQLGSCVQCAGAVREGAPFSVPAGGVVCDPCSGENAVIPLSRAGSSALATLLKARMADVPALLLPEVVVRECFMLLRAFVRYHVPARLKSLEFIEQQRLV